MYMDAWIYTQTIVLRLYFSWLHAYVMANQLQLAPISNAGTLLVHLFPCMRMQVCVCVCVCARMRGLRACACVKDVELCKA